MSLYATDSGRSGWAPATGIHAPPRPLTAALTKDRTGWRPCENVSAGHQGARLIQALRRGRIKDSSRPLRRFYYCAQTATPSVFTQPRWTTVIRRRPDQRRGCADSSRWQSICEADNRTPLASGRTVRAMIHQLALEQWLFGLKTGLGLRRGCCSGQGWSLDISRR
jgi:hypothetical protein